MATDCDMASLVQVPLAVQLARLTWKTQVLLQHRHSTREVNWPAVSVASCESGQLYNWPAVSLARCTAVQLARLTWKTQVLLQHWHNTREVNWPAVSLASCESGQLWVWPDVQLYSWPDSPGRHKFCYNINTAPEKSVGYGILAFNRQVAGSSPTDGVWSL